jgi:CheY-like chemotaxis protein
MSLSAARREPRILLVEDNPVDAILIKRALEDGGFKRAPVVLDDGKPALELLQKQGEFAGDSLPDLIILDLNLRRVHGEQVLRFIRQQPELNALRVIVLSAAPEDLTRASAEQADCCVEKPTDAASFQNLSRRISAFYWGGTADAV